MPSKNLHLLMLNLLSPADVKLGRIVDDPLSPISNFIDPQLPPEDVHNATATTSIINPKSLYQEEKHRSLSGMITSLLSILTSRTTISENNVHGTNMQTFRLRNVATIFNKAIAEEKIQEWLGKAYKGGRSAFMITGYSTVRNLRLEVSKKIRRAASAGIDVSGVLGSTTGLGTSISSPLDSSAGIETRRDSAIDGVHEGETVWAILYQKIQLRSTPIKSSLVPTTPGKVNQWTMMLRTTRAQLAEPLMMEAELDVWKGDAGESGLEEYIDLEFDGREGEIIDVGKDDVCYVLKYESDFDHGAEDEKGGINGD